jgi:MFS family permease
MGRETKAEIAVYKRITLRLIPFIVICYALNFLNRINIGFVKLQMTSDLNISETAYGLAAGLFFLSYSFFQIPSNLILIRLGARKWFSLSLIATGVISTLTLFVTTPTEFYFMRFLLGMVEASFFPGMLYYFTLWYPHERLGRTFALLLFGLSISGVFGGPLSGWIMQYTNQFESMHSWQWLLLVEGVPTVILGGMLPFVLSNNIQTSNWLRTQEKEILEYHLKLSEERNPLTLSLFDLIRDARVWQLIFFYICLFSIISALLFFMPTFMVISGAGNFFSLGLLASIPYISAIALSLLIAHSSDLKGERRLHLFGLTLACALSLLGLAAFPTSIAMTMINTTIATATSLSALVLFWTIPPLFLKGNSRAVGIALINTLGSLGGFLAPYLVGYSKDSTQTFTVALLAMAFICFIASMLIFFFPRNLVEGSTKV